MDVATLGEAKRAAKSLVASFTSPSPANTVVLLGDSIFAACAVALPGTQTPGSGSYANTWSRRSWFHLANQILGQRLTLLNNAGISGNTTGQMLARIQAGVLSYKPGWAIVMGGVNDVQQDVPLATTQANIVEIVTRLRAAGIRVVLCTPLTSGGSRTQLGTAAWAASTAYAVGDVYLQAGVQYKVTAAYTSGASFGATDTTNTTVVPNRLTNMLRLQRWVAAYARDTPGVVPVEWHKIMQDPAAGTNLTSPQATSDGTHPQLTGADRMANFIAPILATRMAAVDHMPAANTDPDSKTLNAMMVGTGGSNASGGTGTVANSVIPEWIGTAGTYTAAKVARTDQIGGEWQKLTLTGSGVLQLRVATTTLAAAGWAVGDVVTLSVEIMAGTDWAGGQLGVYADLVPLTSGFGILGHWRSVDVENGLFSGEQYTLPSGAPSILRTTPMTIPASTSMVYGYLVINGALDGSKPAGTGSVLIGRSACTRADAL